MSETSEKIPFAVEIGRMIEVLAAQIYPTPFALLRENVQNSFDAILLRRHRDSAFEPRIDVTIEQKLVRVEDNGIGMSRADLRGHYWHAGSSSKNTPEARAAGVVGTFGIGAMANFGIAEKLVVESETAHSQQRYRCSAARSTLSVTDDCIDFELITPNGTPGTRVTATMQHDKTIDVKEAEDYIAQFVAFLPIDVFVNEKLCSKRPIHQSVPDLKQTWSWEQTAVDLGAGITADIELAGALNGEVRIYLRNAISGSQKLEGRMVLRQNGGALRTFRSGFGLATVSVNSTYNLGGAADFLFLQPTAGREALTIDCMQLLQSIVGRLDELISLRLAERPESNSNTCFVAWAARRNRFDLCTHLRVRIEPGESLALHEVRNRSQQSSFLVYSGMDAATVKHASEDKPIIVLTRSEPRRICEIEYLRRYCKIEEVTDNPKVLRAKAEDEVASEEKALAFRIGSILSSDYFLEASIRYGTISHGLPVLVTDKKTPIEIYIDPDGMTAKVILELYDREYGVFGHMVKDFVRNMIFPRVSDLVPSATRQGAEAFLKSIHRAREVFEYEISDWENLSALWSDYLNGKLSFQQAAERSARVAQRSYQVLDSKAAGSVRDVVPDVVNNVNEPATDPEYGPMPPIQRMDMSTEKKLLTIDENEPPLKGYRCFIAITDRIRDEKGDFFLQPHRTSVVWGGQKALFIFEHHSGDFGLYYDLQTQSLISNHSGGGSFETCSIVMKNRVFIPIPPLIQASFLPQSDEKKRFEVRCDILHAERRTANKVDLT